MPTNAEQAAFDQVQRAIQAKDAKRLRQRYREEIRDALADEVEALELGEDLASASLNVRLAGKLTKAEARIAKLEGALRELTRRNVLSIYDSEGRRMGDFIGVVLESFNAARAALPEGEGSEAPPNETRESCK